MDPITALGAASSVIGIAAFAVDLSIGLFKVASQVRSASDSIKGLGDTVQSTAFALEEIEKLLREEEEYLQHANTLRIFSVTGLLRVKETASQCLKLLWKIEAVAIGNEEPAEAILLQRLASLDNTTSKIIQLDPKFTSPSVGFWDRVVFAVSTSDKLKEYGRQLQSYQSSLSLIFNVVTLVYLRGKSSLTKPDREAIEKAEEGLHQPEPNIRTTAQILLDGQNPTDRPETTDPNIILAVGHARIDQIPKQHQAPLLGGCSQPDVSTNDVRAVDNIDCDAPQGSRHQSTNDRRLTVQRSTNSLNCVNVSDAGPTALSADGREVYPPKLDQREALNLIKVYTLQRRSDWREEKITYSEIVARLATLDKHPKTALDKKLGLSMGDQSKVDSIQAKVNRDHEDDAECYWNLRQLEIKRGTLNFLRVSRSVAAIIVYLQRETARVHRLMAHLQQQRCQLNRAISWYPNPKAMLDYGDFETASPTARYDYRKTSSAFAWFGRRLGTPGPDQFDDSEFLTAPAADFQSAALGIMEALKARRDSNGNAMALSVTSSEAEQVDASQAELLDEATIAQLMLLLTPAKEEQGRRGKDTSAFVS